MSKEIEPNQEEQERAERFHQMVTFVARYAPEIKLTLPMSSDLMNFVSSIEPAEVGLEDRDDAIAEVVMRVPMTQANEERIGEILERFETKSYVYSKTPNNCNPDAKRILVSASEPLAFNTTLPLLRRLKEDRRCREIMFLTDNVSAGRFAEEGAMGFTDVRGKQGDANAGILEDILRKAEENGGFDVATISFDIRNSPQSLLAHAARASLGAKRLYYVTGGWSGIGGNPLLARSNTLELTDGIFCNDHLGAW